MDNNFDSLPDEPVELQGKPRKMKEFLQDYYQTLGDGTAKFLGIETGITGLDTATLGLDGLIVLGGIAGAGKTSLALWLAVEASRLKTPTLFYSLEMPRRAILTKILNRLSRTKYSDILLKGKKILSDGGETAQDLKSGQADLEAIGERFYLRTRERGEQPINFDAVEEDINHLKAEHSKEKVLVVIDHMQVFDVEDYKDQIDKESILITGFKGISERTGATILLISQKNKAGFTTKGLQTIKGSVDIVYLADVVMNLDTLQERESRENKGGKEYDEHYENITAHYSNNAPKNIDLEIVKNRYNAPQTIKLQFNGAFSDFTEMEER